MCPRPSMQNPTIPTPSAQLCRYDRVLQSRRCRESDPIQHEARTNRSLFPPYHQLPRLGPDPVSGYHQVRRECAAVTQHNSAEPFILRLEEFGHGCVELHGDAEF